LDQKSNDCAGKEIQSRHIYMANPFRSALAERHHEVEDPDEAENVFQRIGRSQVRHLMWRSSQSFDQVMSSDSIPERKLSNIAS
jgi:hypothetical protein